LSFEAAEGEVELAGRGAREVEGGRVALLGEPVYLGPAGVAETQQPGALVERLPGGVVQGLAEHLIAREVVDARQEGVAPARHQAEIGRLDRPGTEGARHHVALQVVHRRERQAARRSQRLPGGDAHEQGPDQARPARDCDLLHLVQGRAPLLERVGYDRVEQLQVPARCHLGHHAPVARMEEPLRRDRVRTDLALARDERRTGVVTAGLDAEDQARAAAARPEPAGAVRHMITASSRLSW
jgi:hypothetical protein